MALPTASDNQFPKVILEEVANDGSATVTPAADHRALFLGEDGALHLKDSAAAVTDISGATADHNHTAAGGDGGDLDAPVIDGHAVFNEESAPSTPSSGTVAIYAKSDGRIYSMDDTGAEFGPFDEAGGGGVVSAEVSGGTETSGGGFQYNAFTSSGDLTVDVTGLADVVIVGAGGGGGNHSGGGAGGGDVIYLENVYLEAGTIAVVIGAGGTPSPASLSIGSKPSPGGVTKFGDIGAAGGGGGGYAISATSGADTTQLRGLDGASGGGGCLRHTLAGGRALGKGSAGGAARTGDTAGTGAGGGGGGAGGVGGTPGGTNNAGAGGNGRDLSADYSAFGASGFFAGGGGGGSVNGGTAGSGTHGGGAGGSGATASNGTANTGGGGGGGGNNGSTPFAGGTGGSGIVIVRTVP